jgi:hypothetical protein
VVLGSIVCDAACLIRGTIVDTAKCVGSLANFQSPYRKNFILSQPGVDFVPFAVETYGTSCREAQEFLEWMGQLAYPLQEVGGKIVDVDGLYGAFISRAYARIAVAVAMGNCQRLEQWLSPLQTEAILRVAEAPVRG